MQSLRLGPIVERRNGNHRSRRLRRRRARIALVAIVVASGLIIGAFAFTVMVAAIEHLQN